MAEQTAFEKKLPNRTIQKSSLNGGIGFASNDFEERSQWCTGFASKDFEERTQWCLCSLAKRKSDVNPKNGSGSSSGGATADTKD